MPKISIREDQRGGQAVYSGRTILLGGLCEDEAANFAAFFRAADRFRGGRVGQVRTAGTRNQAGGRKPG
ncbi:hypothetical protein HCU64_12445 [Methylobacterium sp. C25]|uniref:hypothetical protein n=1 Tax=Methylobacterium sp. C25 TaxID=2721622 RepID=UPI001F2ECBEA|nr:hypothetical protein [Methylobacterium sp. C25]MCE4224566.1 hypothetical protein [Methylobacterium sp. C25]